MTARAKRRWIPDLDWIVVFWMAAMHILALLAPFYFSWTALGLCIAFYYLTGCFGVTFCYHRLLCHRSFATPKWLERLSATCGVLAMQMGPVTWVGHHRMHHAYSDTPGDPHDASRGFWHSHMGWLFLTSREHDDPVRVRKFARDIYQDPYLRFIDQRWVQIALTVLLGFLLYAIAGVPGVVWGIFVRMVVVYHVTWFVNSAAHMWGYQRYQTGDLSRNCWWVGLLAFGEGWHNNHHAHAQVAPAGHVWWEFDITYCLIWVLNRLGLARDVHLPPSWKSEQSAAPVSSTVPVRSAAG